MLIPVEWLKEFVEIEDTPEALAERLTLTGNEIEELRDSESGPVFYLKLTVTCTDTFRNWWACMEMLRDSSFGFEYALIA